MPPKRDDVGYVWDMLDRARAVAAFVEGKTFHDYQRDRMLKSAIERQIEIIGEAASRVSKEFRAQHPGVPWQRIISQRNALAHEYGEIEDELLWVTATVHVPDLISLLERVVARYARPPERENEA